MHTLQDDVAIMLADLLTFWYIILLMLVDLLTFLYITLKVVNSLYTLCVQILSLHMCSKKYALHLMHPCIAQGIRDVYCVCNATSTYSACTHLCDYAVYVLVEVLTFWYMTSKWYILLLSIHIMHTLCEGVV